MKKTVILVHGAGVGGWVYRDVKKILECYGYRVYAPDLLAIKKEKTTLTDYSNEIINLISKENLKDIYLIAHSFGGAVISLVADKIPEKIKYQIYVDSFFLEDGESILKLFGKKREQELVEISKDNYLPKRLFGKEHPLINDMPFEPYKEIVKINKGAKLKSGAYIDCIDGTGFEYLKKVKELMKKRVEERKWKYISLNSDHFPMTKSPAREKLIEILEKLISEN